MFRDIHLVCGCAARHGSLLVDVEYRRCRLFPKRHRPARLARDLLPGYYVILFVSDSFFMTYDASIN